MSRISADDLTHSRAFSTAIEQSKRPVPDSVEKPAQSVRHFNTSRALKAVKDSSTIDFAYLPDFEPESSQPLPRVPIVPDAFQARSTGGVMYETPDAVCPSFMPMLHCPPFSVFSCALALANGVPTGGYETPSQLHVSRQ